MNLHLDKNAFLTLISNISDRHSLKADIIEYEDMLNAVKSLNEHLLALDGEETK